MIEFPEMDEARRQAFSGRRFKHELEHRYRSAQRRRFRVLRISLFLILALGFLQAPLYDEKLFKADASLLPLLRMLELGIAAPANLLAAFLTWRSPNQILVQGTQVAAVLVNVFCILAFRYLALNGHMNYDGQMLGIVLLAVTTFGGFRWVRILLATLVFYSLAIAMELYLANDIWDGALQVYALAFMALITGLGAYTQELLTRIAWINGQKTKIMARTDVLTGLSTRFEFNRLFPRLLRQARREQKIIGIALLDLDHFKNINDSHGHLFGDEVLRRTGRTLLENLARRGLDLRTRYGGEELLLVWYDVTPAAMTQLTGQLLQLIRTIPLEDPKSGEIVALTASVGATWLIPDTHSVPERVLNHADTLLYEAKRAGRDRVRLVPYVEPETRA
ncbi:diguanylate cyclase [Candidatus Skiveiella danica]|uniref:GGDEF domain-containing protein n=1 Tax=Candidatus Skiveiella danica TaxID=3386177 RepID=UPI001D92C393|nr:GGDEF domain-containing protein [Betaproteobacteria bacterium]